MTPRPRFDARLTSSRRHGIDNRLSAIEIGGLRTVGHIFLLLKRREFKPKQLGGLHQRISAGESAHRSAVLSN
jgi:hypothetical protein